jgi:hypothetical protein
MADTWSESGSSVANGMRRGLEYIRGHYRFRNEEKVEDFLQRYPILIDELVRVRPAIARYFSEDTDVDLEVIEDPESVDVRELYAVIRSTYEPTETLDRLARLDEDRLDRTPLDVLQRLVISVGHARRV